MYLRTHARPVRPVTIPGGDVVHVRGLTIAELRRLDQAVAEIEDPAERAIATPLRMAAAALVEANGTHVFDDPASRWATDSVAEAFTPDQLGAICRAVVGDKDEAKN